MPTNSLRFSASARTDIELFAKPIIVLVVVNFRASIREARKSDMKTLLRVILDAKHFMIYSGSSFASCTENKYFTSSIFTSQESLNSVRFVSKSTIFTPSRCKALGNRIP